MYGIRPFLADFKCICMTMAFVNCHSTLNDSILFHIVKKAIHIRCNAKGFLIYLYPSTSIKARGFLLSEKIVNTILHMQSSLNCSWVPTLSHRGSTAIRALFSDPLGRLK